MREASKNGPNPLIEVGDSCPLTEALGVRSFRRVLVTAEVGGDKVLYLFKEGQDPDGVDEKMRGLHPQTVPVGPEITKDEIDEAFDNCPCKDPNVRVDASSAGCIALKTILER